MVYCAYLHTQGKKEGTNRKDNELVEVMLAMLAQCAIKACTYSFMKMVIILILSNVYVCLAMRDYVYVEVR